MKTRMILAAGVVAAVAAAGPASAIVASPSLTLSPTTQVAAGGDGSNGSDNGIHDKTGSQTYTCKDSMDRPTGDTIEYTGSQIAWPPNHKYRTVNIIAHGKSGTMMTSLDTFGSHNEMVSDTEEMNGAGNTDPATDVMPPMAHGEGTDSATTTHQFRGERSGRGTGRTYTFDATASFDGRNCHTTFQSTVPHDQSGHTNSGPKKSAARHRISRR